MNLRDRALREHADEAILNQRYVVFSLTTEPDLSYVRQALGTFRHYTDAYIILRSCQESDPNGNYWIQDDGEMPYGC